MNSGIKIRGFHGNGMCHEITLSNGKVILLDPSFRSTAEEALRETITQADYILITHTHFDHDIDVGYFVEKFNPKVVVGIMSAMPLLKYHHIPYDSLIPVASGEEYHFGDFALEVCRAKHNNSGGRTFNPEDDIARDLGFENHQECDIWGYVESIDFNITSDDNFRIMIASGESVWDAQQRIAEKFAPDLVIRQAGRRNGDMITGQQVEPAVLADFFLSYRAPVVIPAHFDVMLKRWGEEKVREYFSQVKTAMQAKRPASTLLFPETNKIYQIGVSIQE